VSALALIAALSLDRLVVAERQTGSTERAGWTAGAGIGALVSTAVSPKATLVVAPSVETTARRGNLWAPAIRLNVLRSLSQEVGTALGTARFVWTSARLEFCPSRWAPGGTVSLRPCALFELGSLAGDGSEAREPQSRVALWSAGGIVARFDWLPFESVIFEAFAGAFAPFNRARFFFASPDTTAFQVPAVGAFGGAALGMRLP